MSKKGIYLVTPYYQTRVKMVPGTCSRYPERNYTPYRLFALRTRLEPLASKRLKTPVLIHFNQKYLDRRLKVTVEFWSGSRQVSLSKPHYKYLQHALDYITGNEADLALLLSNGSNWVVNDIKLKQSQQTIIPKWWVKDVSKFLSMTPHLRPHYKPKGEYQIGGIYIDLSLFDSHTSFFQSIYLNAVDQLNSLYTRGYLALSDGFDPNKLKRWEVKSLKPTQDSDSLAKTLYYPNWTDQRLTDPIGGPVPFLVKHLIEGSNLVLLEVGSGLIIRHQVSVTFRRVIFSNKYRFMGKYVQVEVNNLKEAQTAASLIPISKTVPVGKIIIFQFPFKEELNLYLTLLQDKTPGFSIINLQGYQIDQPETPYCLSCQIPYNANSYYYQGLIRSWIRNQITQISQLEEIPKTLYPDQVSLPGLGEVDRIIDQTTTPTFRLTPSKLESSKLISPTMNPISISI